MDRFVGCWVSIVLSIFTSHKVTHRNCGQSCGQPSTKSTKPLIHMRFYILPTVNTRHPAESGGRSIDIGQRFLPFIGNIEAVAADSRADVTFLSEKQGNIGCQLRTRVIRHGTQALDASPDEQRLPALIGQRQRAVPFMCDVFQVNQALAVTRNTSANPAALRRVADLP
ncbi:hypothetical protein [Collimonas sp.]|jgi:hypothetical protein|uniref:hypothetical protein n=1 Tax=Collimonas sp. TaxID=1963772 RepID=UPI0037BF3044